MTTQALSEKVYSVSVLNRETKIILAQNFSSIQVAGEISNLATPSSGHIYFTLKDNHAQVRCAMFRSRHRRTAFKAENGQQVLVRADVSLFEQRGDYQLVVESMERAGDGALRQQFEELLQKLSKEGLFSEDKKKPLPPFPNTIGIITSPTGAAIQDVLAVFKRRAPYIQINIYPTPVQGADSEKRLQQAIRTADQRNECDLLILARGGGSEEDLNLFNSERVAREIYKCKTAIISGIGHETDFTIADFVADKRAATPSVAAESACKDNEQLLHEIRQNKSLLVQSLLSRISQYHQQLDWIKQRLLQQHPRQQLIEKSQRLDELETRLQQTAKKQLDLSQLRLKTTQNRFNGQSPLNKILALQSQQRYLEHQLFSAIKAKYEHKKQQFHETIRTLEAISPLSTLARGYAIVSKSESQQLISSSANIKVGQSIEAQLSKGRLTCQVTEIHND
jgi:exodeoxyribonuclease VII large subunit